MKKVIVLLMMIVVSLPSFAAKKVSKKAHKQPKKQSLEQRTERLETAFDYMMRDMREIKQHPHQLVNNPRQYTPPDLDAGHFDPQHDVYHQGLFTYLGGTPITSSPYLGIRSEFDASDLIVNFSSIGQDVRLLEHRQLLENNLIAQGDPIPKSPVVDLSGAIEVSGCVTSPYVGNATGDLDLTRGQLDIAALVNHWASGIFVINYDNGGGIANRINNSRLFIDQALFTLGNLNESPFYVSAGQYFVTFGRFGSYMITNNLAKTMGRTKARAFTLGFRGPYGLSLSGFAFNGASHGGNSHTVGGADVEYAFDVKPFALTVGASVISNFAEAGGFQNTSAVVSLVPVPGMPATLKPSFVGFAFSDATEHLYHRLPGVDFRAKGNVNHFSAQAEYVAATRRFNMADLSYNGHGAQPSALNVEAAYHFYVSGVKPATIAIGYGHTYQALALDMPKHRIAIAMTINFMKDTIFGLEYRHDTAYDVTDTGTGAGCPVVLTTIPGKSLNAVKAFFGVYF